MASFDPDKYLAEKQSNSFDPDQYLAEKGSKTSGNAPSLAERAVKGVNAVLQATKEAGTPPLTLEDAAKAFSPETGQFGASIPLQRAGEEVAEAAPKATELLGGLRASDVPSGIAQAAAGEAVAPVARAIGRPIAKVMGGLSGAGDVIGKVGADPSLLFAPGSKAADYGASDAAKSTSALLGEKSPKAMIDAAEEAAKEGTLSASEALEARKEVGRLFESKTITGEAQRRLYSLFDGIAKSDPLIAKADETFARGKIADVARSPLPLNASGEPASLKSLVLGGSLGGGMANHPVTAALGPAMFSPIVQSALAAGAGASSEAIPALLAKALQAREQAGTKPTTISDALAAALKNIRKEQ